MQYATIFHIKNENLYCEWIQKDGKKMGQIVPWWECTLVFRKSLLKSFLKNCDSYLRFLGSKHVMALMLLTGFFMWGVYNNYYEKKEVILFIFCFFLK